MTEEPHSANLVAVIKPCEQFSFRVELSDIFDVAVRDDIMREALLESTATYLECTRKFQSIAWIGDGNVAFAQSRFSPSDCKFPFLQQLVCLKALEIGFHKLGEIAPARDPGDDVVRLEVATPYAFRHHLKVLCKTHGIGIQSPAFQAHDGIDYRGTDGDRDAFAPMLFRKAQSVGVRMRRDLKDRPVLKRLLRYVPEIPVRLAWIYHIILRIVFHVYYRAAFRRVMKRIARPDVVFLYFESRSGRNRDIGGYLAWKYGVEFTSSLGNASPIPFSHLKPIDAYSRAAMAWARRSLRRMESEPLDGCVLVNYLMPPRMLVTPRLAEKQACRRIRTDLEKLAASEADFLANTIYNDFLFLFSDRNKPLEIANSYQEFFASFPPGVLIQADALARGARQFTASARRRGGQVIYVADRICTRLRTSNQLLADGGDNAHFPDRCVVFDTITVDELLRQGFPPERILRYPRSMGVETDSAITSHGPERLEVLILLQAYSDNPGAMISAGVDLLEAYSDMGIILQEHPHYPIKSCIRLKLLNAHPGRLRFLQPGEKVDHSTIVAMITGYSTAAIPGILQGVPLIWLRRQIDNSAYGEPYLKQIGLSADCSAEVCALIRLLRGGDPPTLARCSAATEAVSRIFSLSPGQSDSSLAAALHQAVRDSFSAIRDAPENAGADGIS